MARLAAFGCSPEVEVQTQHRKEVGHPADAHVTRHTSLQAGQHPPRKTGEAREPGMRQPQCLAPPADDGAPMKLMGYKTAT